MNVLNQSIIKHKMGLLNLADDLRNVSQACRVMGVSRDTFYRVKEAKESGGLEALLHKDRRRSNLKNRVDEAVEKAVLGRYPKVGRVCYPKPVHPERRSSKLVHAEASASNLSPHIYSLKSRPEGSASKAPATSSTSSAEFEISTSMNHGG